MNPAFLQAVFGSDTPPAGVTVSAPEPRVGLVGRAVRAVARVIAPEKVQRFIDAVTGPACSEEEYDSRLAICRANTCGQLRARENRLYCGACGCPNWHLAELHVKLRFADLECPLGLWGAG